MRVEHGEAPGRKPDEAIEPGSWSSPGGSNSTRRSARAERALSLIRGLYRLERSVQTAIRKKREEVRRHRGRPSTSR